ncbi:uncharacterized protein EAE98_011267 [Botrytis deweyae]|uniref:Uncharacterized protein n=1 Tax=Botrytis deweyae TaxID=2478750 RepID=A0ABQ7I6H0_9HELO|nr:uncharacterized protein EAE98_011267 [Botrytis deweyae]KAF7915182.1 hypothetical protein EAE98_011267 [Botrytis deweyae]
MAWETYDVSQSFVERNIGLWRHGFHVLSGAPSLILAAIRYIQDIGTYSSDAGFGGSKGYVICNSNDSFRTNPMEDFTIESAFAKTLIKSLAVYDSIVSQMKAVSTGATELRKVFTSEQLPDIFRSYMVVLKKAYIIGIAVVGMMFFVVFSNKCHNLKGITTAKTAKEKGEIENENSEFEERREV